VSEMRVQIPHSKESEVVDIPIDRLDVHPINAELYVDTSRKCGFY